MSNKKLDRAKAFVYSMLIGLIIGGIVLSVALDCLVAIVSCIIEELLLFVEDLDDWIKITSPLRVFLLGIIAWLCLDYKRREKYDNGLGFVSWFYKRKIDDGLGFVYWLISIFVKDYKDGLGFGSWVIFTLILGYITQRLCGINEAIVITNPFLKYCLYFAFISTSIVGFCIYKLLRYKVSHRYLFLFPFIAIEKTLKFVLVAFVIFLILFSVNVAKEIDELDLE